MKGEKLISAALGAALFFTVFVVSLIFIGDYSLSSLRGQQSAQLEHSNAASRYLNPYILRVAERYPTDGSYGGLPPDLINTSMGTTKDIYYDGVCVIRGDEQRRSYCVGLMLEVYMEAAQLYQGEQFGTETLQLPGLLRADFRQFRRDFYGFDGNQRTFVDALVGRSLGREISDLNALEPGDLIQFWRNNGTGHSVVFLSWDRDPEGNKTRMHYWSVQRATNGISENREHIGLHRNDIDPERIYCVRPFLPAI